MRPIVQHLDRYIDVTPSDALVPGIAVVMNVPVDVNVPPFRRVDELRVMVECDLVIAVDGGERFKYRETYVAIIPPFLVVVP